MCPTGKRVTISYRLEETTPTPTYNVAGVIRGADPELRDEADGANVLAIRREPMKESCP